MKGQQAARLGLGTARDRNDWTGPIAHTQKKLIAGTRKGLRVGSDDSGIMVTCPSGQGQSMISESAGAVKSPRPRVRRRRRRRRPAGAAKPGGADGPNFELDSVN